MKKNQNTTLWLIITTLLFCFILTACGEKDPLIGTWQEANSMVTFQFIDDGNVVISNPVTSQTLAYVKQDPDIIQIKGSSDGSLPEMVMNFRIEEDRLILSLQGNETVLVKVK